MQPCLLLVLALALLGTACASRHAPGSPEAVPPGGDDEDRCPLEGERHAFAIRDRLRGTTLNYVVVKTCASFFEAERTCSRCYRGRLASIHSLSVNVQLQHRASLCTNRRQLWIGATTYSAGVKVQCRWIDRSYWDFSFWLQGNPLHYHNYCTSLSTTNGRWTSHSCQLRLPFICEY